MALTDYAGKVALITGGSSGIGFGLAQALVERGARVALAGTDRARADAAAEALGHDAAIGIALDVAARDAWPEAVAQVERELGPIDLLVLNAGAQGGRHRIEDVPPEQWDWAWSVNVDGVFNGLRACLPAMRARGTPGHVLVTASIAALLPRATVATYGAAKAAALALAEAARLELEGSAIGVSAFCPGLVRTAFAQSMRRHAPGADDDTFAFMTAAIEQGLDPRAVGRTVADAMLRGDFYIFTHPELAGIVRTRLAEIDAALGAAA